MLKVFGFIKTEPIGLMGMAIALGVSVEVHCGT